MQRLVRTDETFNPAITLLDLLCEIDEHAEHTYLHRTLIYMRYENDAEFILFELYHSLLEASSSPCSNLQYLPDQRNEL